MESPLKCSEICILNDCAPLQTKVPYPVYIYAIKNVNIFSIMNIKMIFVVLNLLFLLAYNIKFKHDYSD